MNIGDMSVTFKLKKNAKFHDGTPVAAKDVKWSLDRAVSVGGFPTFQMSAGLLTKPEQFVVVDDTTVRLLGRVAYALSGLLDARMQKAQNDVLGAAGKLSATDLSQLPVVHLSA